MMIILRTAENLILKSKEKFFLLLEQRRRRRRKQEVQSNKNVDKFCISCLPFVFMNAAAARESRQREQREQEVAKHK